MKNDNHTRVFGPLSAGCILMLALSACSTSVQGIGSEDSTHGGSGASSSASATSHEKQIVGLTEIRPVHRARALIRSLWIQRRM